MQLIIGYTPMKITSLMLKYVAQKLPPTKLPTGLGHNCVRAPSTFKAGFPRHSVQGRGLCTLSAHHLKSTRGF